MQGTFDISVNLLNSELKKETGGNVIELTTSLQLKDKDPKELKVMLPIGDKTSSTLELPELHKLTDVVWEKIILEAECEGIENPKLLINDEIFCKGDIRRFITQKTN